MHTTTFELRTSGRDQLLDITERVAGVIAQAGADSGIVHVFVPHTTAGVTINENADPDVVHDVLEALDRAIPWQQDFYRHGEGNSAAHVKSSLVGCSLSAPFAHGRLMLGTWQAIYFAEFDGPRTRRVIVTISPG